MDSCDRLIIERAREGNEDAFARLVESHWLPLVRFARSIVGDLDAEDAVQESFLVAWRKIGALKNVESFNAWMLRIVSRRCFRRAGMLARFVPWLEALKRPEPSVEADAAQLEVEEILRALPPQQRAVMHLTVMEQMSDSEIGSALGIRPASVRSHRRRARQLLAHLLAGRAIGQEEVA